MLAYPFWSADRPLAMSGELALECLLILTINEQAYPGQFRGEKFRFCLTAEH